MEKLEKLSQNYHKIPLLIKSSADCMCKQAHLGLSVPTHLLSFCPAEPGYTLPLQTEAK